ncbi:MAG: Na+/H+ antiporter NhaC family protein, partial [Gemmiger sp.]
MDETKKKLTFRGSMYLSLVPVAIYVFFCVILFVVFKAFNMEALAVGGFLALLIGGLFCTSYTDFWDSAIRGISSITSVSVVVILLLVGMFSQLIKTCGLSGGFVWLANELGIQGGLFVAFTFLATCIVSTATGSSIGTMFIAFPIFYPAGLILGAGPMWMAGSIVSGAIFGDNLAPISDTTIASSSSQQFRDGRPADVGGVVSSRLKYSAVAGGIALVIYALVGGMGGTYQGGSIDAASNPVTLVMLIPVVV